MRGTSRSSTRRSKRATPFPCCLRWRVAVEAADSQRVKHDSILSTIGNTPLVQVPALSPDASVRIWVKLEGENPTGSVKDRIALAMVDAGEASGELTADRTILEPTSGNTGIALAMVASRRGYAFTAVMPDNASMERVS